MKYLVVIDTNVLVSALLTHNDASATVKVIRMLFEDDNIIPLYSQETIKEYEEVLHRKKFRFNISLINNLIETIKNIGILVEPLSTNENLPDIKDLPFYEIVMEKQDDNAYLVTGNIKHFPIKRFIVTPREFLTIFEKGS